MKKILIILCIIFSITFTGCRKNDANNMDNGNNAFNQKDYISAIKFYKKEINKNPQNAQAYSQYCGAECYAYDSNKKIDLNNTILLCNKSIELNSNIAETYFYKGRIYGQLDRNKEAIQEYSKAIKVNPNYERAYLNRGVTKSKLGSKKDAISDFTKVIELDNEEDLLLAYSNRGVAYAQIGENQKADADFKKVANFDIKNANAIDYALRGRAKFQIKDFSGAVFDLKKAIEIDETEAEYYFSLAKSQVLLNDYDGVINTSSIGIKKCKENTEILYMLRGSAKGSKELFLELSNKRKQHDFTDAYSDLKTAQDLALKNNNKNIYKESIKIKNDLQNLAIKAKSVSQNASFSFGNNDNSKLSVKASETTAKQSFNIRKNQKLNNNCNNRSLFILSYWNTINANLSESEKLINQFYNDSCTLGEMDRNSALAFNSGIASEHTQNIKEKISLIKNAYNYAIKSNQNWNADHYAIKIGKLYYKIHNYSEAIEWYQKALPSYNKHNHKPFLLPAFMADCYVELQDYKTARDLYNETLINLQNNWQNSNLPYYNQIRAKMELIKNK